MAKKKTIPHLEAIGRSGIIWRGQCRVDGVKGDIAKLIKDSGCVTMCMGVESVSQTSLDLVRKNIKVEKARESIRLLKEAGIETRIYMIIGLPGEPHDIVSQTWQFIKDTEPDSVYLSLFTVRPGTDVYENPQKYSIKDIGKDWDSTMHMHGRYDKEMPTLTYTFEEQASWGPSMSNQQIVENYLTLQERIKANGYGPVGYTDKDNKKDRDRSREEKS